MDEPLDNSARVTFDREVQCVPELEGQLLATLREPTRIFDCAAILELKFTARIPGWAHELIQTFSLVQTGAAKYAEGIVRMGEARVAPQPAPAAGNASFFPPSVERFAS